MMAKVDSSFFHTDGKPAPGRLEMVHGFLNTWSDELNLEELGTPSSAGKWLRQAGLWTDRKNPSEGDVDRLTRFRASIRRYVLSGGDEAASVDLVGFAPAVGFNVVAQEGPLELIPAGSGMDHAIGVLLSIIYDAQKDGSWDRFKCCELETCGWAFYDHTKNRSGRWCSMKTCGSRHKAREYLKRKAQKGN